MIIFVKLMASGWFFLIGFLGFVAYISLRRPVWVENVAKIFSPEWSYENPFYFFKRWTWEKPPENWRSKLCLCISSIFVFGFLPIYFVLTLDGPKPWGFIAVPALMSIHFAIFSVRIVLRIWSIKRKNISRIG